MRLRDSSRRRTPAIHRAVCPMTDALSELPPSETALVWQTSDRSSEIKAFACAPSPTYSPKPSHLLALPDNLVGEVREAVTDGPGFEEAHGHLVAGLAEETLASSEHDRVDQQPQLVDQVVVH
jgi:hypothetical protein